MKKLERVFQAALLASLPFASACESDPCDMNACGSRGGRTQCVAEPEAGPIMQLDADGGLVLDCKVCPNYTSAPYSGGCYELQGSPPKIVCTPDCTGRRPRGLADEAFDSRDCGDYFARMAWLEEASIIAFRVLADDLRRHGAPVSLVRRASRSAREEIVHARLTKALAAPFGRIARRPKITPARPRSLEALAIENVVEGCVRETLGALVALHQATRSTDMEIRHTFRQIAVDETRHAALAWSIHRWLTPRLTKASRRRVARARRRAVEEVATSISTRSALLGLPSTPALAAMVASLRATLWA